MPNTFKNTSVRGFTLIELLVVIAIIGLLSTIIAAPIQNARKKARDSKKIAEIKAVQLALDQYAEANTGSYPVNLSALQPIYMPLVPSFASTTLASVSNRDKFGYTPYIYTGTGMATTTFAYHLGVHLENFSQGLDNDRDCYGADNKSNFTDIAGTSTCAYYPGSTIFGGYQFGAILTSGTFIGGGPGWLMFTVDNYKNGMLPPHVADASYTVSGGEVTDFRGADNDTAKCNATEDCVFDVTAQQ